MPRAYSGLDVHSDIGGQFPFPSRLVDVGDGVRQAYVDEGPRDARTTFLLLHGNPTWGYLWRRFIPPLAREHRVIVPDHVGFGRSDKPRDLAYYTLDRHVENLTRVLDAADARNVVPVVQDWGGPIGMGWAVRHADRVRGVVLLNTWAFVRDPPMKLPLLFKILVLGEGGRKRAMNSNFFTEFFLRKGGLRPLDDRVMEGYRAAHPTPEDRAGIAAFPRMIPETAKPDHPAWRTMAEIEDGLAKIREKPALIVWPTRDQAFKEVHLRRWQGAFAKVDGPHRVHARHYCQEDAPEEILARIQSWARTLE